MNGGASGLSGYIYQQRYLAFQILSSEAASLLPNYSAPMKIQEFSIEGRTGEDGPAWDVRLLSMIRVFTFVNARTPRSRAKIG